MEHGMTEQLNVQQMAEKLLAADNILILCHKNPDGDTVGCGSALYYALLALEKHAAVLCADPIPGRYAFTNPRLFKGEFEPQIVVAVDVASVQLFGEGNGVPQYTRHVDLCIDHHAGNSGYAEFTLLEGSAAIPFKMPELPNFRTRDFVTMWGTIDSEPFFFLVSHWPSRLGGKEASAPKRLAAAKQVKHIVDSVTAANPATKVVVMGDLNDDATDDSIVEGLNAKGKIKEVGKGDMFNPFIGLLKAGYGTLAYRDEWNLFDNIIVSENLATGSTGSLKIQPAGNSKFYGGIFRRPYMIQKEGQYKGYPLRTFVGNDFQGGFSDHFPVYIYIAK